MGDNNQEAKQGTFSKEKKKKTNKAEGIFKEQKKFQIQEQFPNLTPDELAPVFDDNVKSITTHNPADDTWTILNKLAMGERPQLEDETVVVTPIPKTEAPIEDIATQKYAEYNIPKETQEVKKPEETTRVLKSLDFNKLGYAPDAIKNINEATNIVQEKNVLENSLKILPKDSPEYESARKRRNELDKVLAFSKVELDRKYADDLFNANLEAFKQFGFIPLPDEAKNDLNTWERIREGALAIPRGFNTVFGNSLEGLAILSHNLMKSIEPNAKLEDNSAYKLGKWLVDVNTPDYTTRKSYIEEQILNGVGTSIGFMVGAYIFGPETPWLSMATRTALMGGMSQFSEEYVKATLKNYDNAASVGAWNFLFGMSEAAPLAKFFEGLAPFTKKTATQLVKDMLIQGMEEGSQEMFQQLGQNITAHELYDKTQPLGEGVLQSGAVAFLSGMLMTGAFSLASKISAKTNQIKEAKQFKSWVQDIYMKAYTQQQEELGNILGAMRYQHELDQRELIPITPELPTREFPETPKPEDYVPFNFKALNNEEYRYNPFTHKYGVWKKLVEESRNSYSDKIGTVTISEATSVYQASFTHPIEQLEPRIEGHPDVMYKFSANPNDFVRLVKERTKSSNETYIAINALDNTTKEINITSLMESMNDYPFGMNWGNKNYVITPGGHLIARGYGNVTHLPDVFELKNGREIYTKLFHWIKDLEYSKGLEEYIKFSDAVLSLPKELVTTTFKIPKRPYAPRKEKTFTQDIQQDRQITNIKVDKKTGGVETTAYDNSYEFIGEKLPFTTTFIDWLDTQEDNQKVNVNLANFKTVKFKEAGTEVKEKKVVPDLTEKYKELKAEVANKNFNRVKEIQQEIDAIKGEKVSTGTKSQLVTLSNVEQTIIKLYLDALKLLGEEQLSLKDFREGYKNFIADYVNLKSVNVSKTDWDNEHGDFGRLGYGTYSGIEPSEIESIKWRGETLISDYDYAVDSAHGYNTAEGQKGVIPLMWYQFYVVRPTSGHDYAFAHEFQSDIIPEERDIMKGRSVGREIDYPGKSISREGKVIERDIISTVTTSYKLRTLLNDVLNNACVEWAVKLKGLQLNPGFNTEEVENNLLFTRLEEAGFEQIIQATQELIEKKIRDVSNSFKSWRRSDSTPYTDGAEFVENLANKILLKLKNRKSPKSTIIKMLAKARKDNSTTYNLTTTNVLSMVFAKRLNKQLAIRKVTAIRDAAHKKARNATISYFLSREYMVNDEKLQQVIDYFKIYAARRLDYAFENLYGKRKVEMSWYKETDTGNTELVNVISSPFMQHMGTDAFTISLQHAFQQAYDAGMKYLYLPGYSFAKTTQGSELTAKLYSNPFDHSTYREDEGNTPFYLALKKLEKKTGIKIVGLDNPKGIKTAMLKIDVSNYKEPLTLFQKESGILNKQRDLDLIRAIQVRLAKQFPNIKVTESTEDMHDESGRVLGQINLNDAEVLINAAYEVNDTRAHEYAHYFVNTFKGTDLIQAGLEAFGGEEKLVQHIGEYYSGRMKDPLFIAWFKEFLFWLKGVLGFQQAIGDKIAHEFYTTKDINDKRLLNKLGVEKFSGVVVKAALADALRNQIEDENTVNLDPTKFVIEAALEDNPDMSQLDKVSEREQKEDLGIRMDTNGVLQALRKEVSTSMTPDDLLAFVQQFKTGNQELDWANFQQAWIDKFGDVWADKPSTIPSNRTFLQQVFVSLYHSSKIPSVKVEFNQKGTATVTPYTQDAYTDADGKVKSTVAEEELWQKIAKILPEGMKASVVRLVNYKGTKYNSFNEIRFNDETRRDNQATENELVNIRRGLMKQGYLWLGIIPNSKTGIVISADFNLNLEQATEEQLDQAYAGLYDQIVLPALFGNIDTFAKIKRSKAIVGTSPTAFVFDDAKELLRNMSSTSAVYLTTATGKTEVNYKYVVLDANSIDSKFKSEIGDGHEVVSGFLMKVINTINGTPYFKRGGNKPKFFDIGRFWKWARTTVNPNSPLAAFMKKNRIAGVILSSAIKVGRTENMITGEDIERGKVIGSEFIYEHNLMQDSNTNDKGKISAAAAGLGPNVRTTLIYHLLPAEAKLDMKAWLERDYSELRNYIDGLLKDPARLTQEIVDYAKRTGYVSDVTTLISHIEGRDYLGKLPAVMEYAMAGYFRDLLFNTVRHFKKGSAPMFTPDMGNLTGYKNLNEVVARRSFFKQKDENSCGVCATNSILGMYGLPPVQEDIDTSEGTSPRQITTLLNQKGIKTNIRDDLKYNDLKPRSVVYYPGNDHYVTVEQVRPNKVFVNDSLKDKGHWVDKADFEKLWEGWAIETEGKSNNLAEAFDEDGYLKEGYAVIDYWTAKEKGYKVGDKYITVLNPPGAFVDMKVGTIAAILPKEMGKNLFVGNVKEYQDLSGKDYDADTVGLIKVSDELDLRMWEHLDKAKLTDRFTNMMNSFEDRSKARSILQALQLPTDEKNISEWARIAPLIRLNDNEEGVFALNDSYGTMSLSNTNDWGKLMRMAKEGLIGNLYSWKAIYTLFLENDYSLNGIKANPDINFNIPMLKVLTDMALDWTKQFDIGKLQFNWEDLVRQLFKFPEVDSKMREQQYKQFIKALYPIREASRLTGLRDKENDTMDYVTYFKQLLNARIQLSKMPPGLQNSLIAMTTKGITALNMPKLALTTEQSDRIQQLLKGQMLEVPENRLAQTQRDMYNSLRFLGLSKVTSVFKALSFLGTRVTGSDAELANIKLLRDYTKEKLSATDNFPLNTVYFSWLDSIMDNMAFKKDGLIDFGAEKDGYKFAIESKNGTQTYFIRTVKDGHVTASSSFTTWKEFVQNAPATLFNYLLEDSFMKELQANYQLSSNPVVKQQSDMLLDKVFGEVIKSDKFQKVQPNVRRFFYYGILGMLNQIRQEEIYGPGQIDIGMIVNDTAGLRDVANPLLFRKARAISYAKPITYLLNHAMEDDIAKEVVEKWFNNMNSLIEQELKKEEEIDKPEKVLSSLFFPIPLLSNFKQSDREGIKHLEKVLGPEFSSEEQRQKYIDTLMDENFVGVTERERHIFSKLIMKGVTEADKRFGLKWRLALFNPIVNAHTIPFDVFIDIFGKKNKLYSGFDKVYKYPLNGRFHEIFAWEVDMKFRHWGEQDKAKLLSGAQIYWYIQDSLDRTYETMRVDNEKLVSSVTSYMIAKVENMRDVYIEQAAVQNLKQAFDMAENPDFQSKLGSFDLTSDAQTYYTYARTLKADATNDELRTIVGAMRYRYLLDQVAPSLIKQGIKNMELAMEQALEKTNMAAYTVAEGFKKQLEDMQTAVSKVKAYMPHAWYNERALFDAAFEAYSNGGLRSDTDAKNLAKKLMEEIQAGTTHIGGTGQFIDMFFKERKVNLQGYEKTAVPVSSYFKMLTQLLKFQHSYVMQEFGEDLLKDEIPFVKKHAREMSAIARGANKYGIKVDVAKLKKGNAVMFVNKKTGELTTGIVARADKNSFFLKDGQQFSRFGIEALRVLHGTNVLTRAKLMARRLGLPVKSDITGKLAQKLLRLEAASMLTGTTFAMRNMIGGTIQNLILYGEDVFGQATKLLGGVNLATLAAKKGFTFEEKDKKAWELVYDNSIALLGNLSEVMGKFGGVLDLLKDVEGLDSKQVEQMIALGVEWNGVKADLKDYGLNKDENKFIKFWNFWNKFVPITNLNFFQVVPGINKIPAGVFVPAEGEKRLRFTSALMAYFAHSDLDITDPIEKRIMIAFMDEAVRNTQFLYRIGLDQGILESSPFARSMFVNYLHYPISSFTTALYYIDNARKQKERYGKNAFLWTDDSDIKKYGKRFIPVTVTIGKGSPSEKSFTFRDIRYARVVRQMFKVGLVNAIITKYIRTAGNSLKYTLSPLGNTLLWAAGVTGTSYVNPITQGIWQALSIVMSLAMQSSDDKDLVHRIRRTLYLTQDEYLEQIQANKHDAKFLRDVTDDMLKNEYVRNMINDIAEDFPMGVGQGLAVQGVVTALLADTLLPENFQEWGVSVANTFLPIRPLRSPLFGAIWENAAYPLGIGFTPLQSKRIQYFRQNESNSKSSRFNRVKH